MPSPKEGDKGDRGRMPSGDPSDHFGEHAVRGGIGKKTPANSDPGLRKLIRSLSGSLPKPDPLKPDLTRQISPDFAKKKPGNHPRMFEEIKQSMAQGLGRSNWKSVK